MQKRVYLCLLMASALYLVLPAKALALGAYLANFTTQYQAAYQAAHPGQPMTINADCSLCHPGNVTTAANLNPYGTDFGNSGHNFVTIEGTDSDGDTFSNLTEIMALPQTFPGDATSFPPPPDTTIPTVTAFVIPAAANSLVVPITTFTATDDVGVTGYLVTESATAPLPGDAGWTALPPADFAFLTAGAKTLFAWAKDAAGNVSLSMNAGVTITLADAVAPTVTAFIIPVAVNSLVVPILTLTATDNVKVTGIKVTKTKTAPLPGDKGWTASKPANFTFLKPGIKKLYAWAKDAAGNVSLAKSATVTITLLDAVKPTVTVFTVPAISTSLRVPITAIVAADNAGVTGYFVTGSFKAPLAGSKGWFPVPPPNYNYTFLPDPLHSNVKTLFAWAKDAAGNVSLAKKATVTINQTDTAKPVVTGFTAAPAATPLKANITLFTATDNVAVTGYRVTTTQTAPLAGAFGWMLNAPQTFTFTTGGAKKLFAWARDAAGNVSLAKTATVTVAAPPNPLLGATSTMPAPGATVPLPAAGEILDFVHDPVAAPVISPDPALAMPIGLGPAASGGDALQLVTELAPLEGPVDAYLSLQLSSGEDDTQVFNLDGASNSFTPTSETTGPWRSGVVTLNETVWATVPISDLTAGTYTISLEVTRTGERDSRYRWTTSITIE